MMSNEWNDDMCEACELEGCPFDETVEGVDYSNCIYIRWVKARVEELLKDGVRKEEAKSWMEEKLRGNEL